MTKLLLPSHLVNQLLELPESGQGYQLVNIKLTNGVTLANRRILNSSELMLDPNEDINSSMISEINLVKHDHK